MREWPNNLCGRLYIYNIVYILLVVVSRTLTLILGHTLTVTGPLPSLSLSPYAHTLSLSLYTQTLIVSLYADTLSLYTLSLSHYHKLSLSLFFSTHSLSPSL